LFAKFLGSNYFFRQFTRTHDIKYMIYHYTNRAS
jgi:hypothetical protein